jgi:hypothetical protein
MDMDAILEQLDKASVTESPYVEPVKEKTLEELGPFQFSTEKDDAGLLFQHPRYVKKNCINCNGRGATIQSFGGRRWQACGCMIRGYQKHRREHDIALAKVKAAAEKVLK